MSTIGRLLALRREKEERGKRGKEEVKGRRHARRKNREGKEGKELKEKKGGPKINKSQSIAVVFSHPVSKARP